MNARFCDDRGDAGFSWIVEEPMTRTSHALVADGRTWLVDPVDWPDAIERACASGDPVGVLQLLDRHNRDCASIAGRLDVPHLVAPDAVPASPFDCIPVRRTRRWAETALWWHESKTLVIAEAVATNRFFTGGKEAAGVHLLLRLSPPRMLEHYAPLHLLVGHGEGIHGAAATTGLSRAIARSRRDLPRVVLQVPGLALDARRRRRSPGS